MTDVARGIAEADAPKLSTIEALGLDGSRSHGLLLPMGPARGPFP
jgi:hypothetical protein